MHDATLSPVMATARPPVNCYLKLKKPPQDVWIFLDIHTLITFFDLGSVGPFTVARSAWNRVGIGSGFISPGRTYGEISVS